MTVMASAPLGDALQVGERNAARPESASLAGPPKVSVIVVNYNNSAFVINCVRSVLRSSYPLFDVIVVDNGSTDGSMESLRRSFDSERRVELMETHSNAGFGVAANMGARRASGSILVFLNDDTLVEEDWLTEPSSLLRESNDVAAVRAAVASMQDPNKTEPLRTYIDALGTSAGLSEAGAKGEETSHTAVANGAAFFIKKEFFRRTGGWDESYFLYHEDIDLSWRIWLFGGTILYSERSRIYHRGSVTADKTVRRRLQYLAVRNKTQSLIKNYSTLNMLKYLLASSMVLTVASLNQTLRRNSGTVLATIRGCAWVLANLRQVMRKRAYVQEFRTVDDSALFSRGIIRKVEWDKLFRMGLS